MTVDLLSPAQLVGYLAMGISIWAQSRTCDRKMAYQAAGASSVWGIHFMMLNQPTVVFMFVMIALRQVSYPWLRAQGSRMKTLFFCTFSGVSITLSALTWANWISFLSVGANLLAIYAFSYHIGLKLRFQIFLVFAIWVIVAVLTNSIGLAISSSLNALSALYVMKKLAKVTGT